jgi:hypothetical protein
LLGRKPDLRLSSSFLAASTECSAGSNDHFVVATLQRNIHAILQHNNHATLQRNNNAKLQRNNHATLQRNNHATLQSNNYATSQRNNNATITQSCKNQNCNVVVNLLDLEKQN